MKYNIINIKLKYKNNIHLINNKILEFINLSIGNNIIDLKYNQNQNKTSNQNLEFICKKKFIKYNIGKMIYKTNENSKELKILNDILYQII